MLPCLSLLADRPAEKAAAELGLQVCHLHVSHMVRKSHVFEMGGPGTPAYADFCCTDILLCPFIWLVRLLPALRRTKRLQLNKPRHPNVEPLW